MHHPHHHVDVQNYINQEVIKAFESVRYEFKRRHLNVLVKEVEDGLQLSVDHHDEFNFIYKVIARPTVAPSFMMDEEHQETDNFYQAEVFLREGGQNYNVMDWTQDDLLQDIIDQYERHLHFLNVVRN